MHYLRWLIPLCITLPLPAFGQGVNPAYPIEIQAQKHASPEEMRERLASVALQKDAKELTNLCGTVGKDMDGIKAGVLSKDTIDRLKQLEKLSKRVREQLTRAPARP